MTAAHPGPPARRRPCSYPAPGAAAHADLLLLSLASDQAVNEMLSGPDGALAGAPPGILNADTSTVSPDAARSIARRVTESGPRALAACVLGNVKHARDGELRFTIGDVAELRPLLDVLAKDVLHLGGHGMGAAAKVTLNLLMAVEMQALAEAVVFGERAGLDRAQVLDMISASGAPVRAVSIPAEPRSGTSGHVGVVKEGERSHAIGREISDNETAEGGPRHLARDEPGQSDVPARMIDKCKRSIICIDGG